MRAIAAVAAALALVAGCALPVNGLLSAGAGDLDAAAPPATDAANAEAEAVDPVDAACPPSVGDAPVTVAARASTPPTIDGNLDEWRCGPWTELSETNAAYALSDAGGQAISGQYAVRWDDSYLYVAASMVVPTLQGDNTTDVYQNDAIEIYVSGDGPLTGQYDTQSHQYIVDWHDHAVDYAPEHYAMAGPTLSDPPNFESKTRIVSGAWQLEAAIGWQALLPAGPGFSEGMSIGFDVAFDDGDGTAQMTQLIAILTPHAMACGCPSCCCGQGQGPDQPFCDTLCFGALTLE